MSKLRETMAAVKILRQGRDYITDSAHWIKGHLGHKSRGGLNDFTTYAECNQVCALGTIAKAADQSQLVIFPGSSGILGEHMAVKLLAHAISGPESERIGIEGAVYEFNDKNTVSHAEVLLAFDCAIEDGCKIVQEEAKKQNGQEDNTAA
jgi:hypothetical protein